MAICRINRNWNPCPGQRVSEPLKDRKSAIDWLACLCPARPG